MEECGNKKSLATCCKACRSRYYKERYLKRKTNPAYTTEKHKGENAKVNSSSHRVTLRKIVYTHYENNPCEICGETRIACLQFDHLRDKRKSVAKLVSAAVSVEVLLTEIAKCRVLCANCHAVHTAEQFGWYSWRNTPV